MNLIIRTYYLFYILSGGYRHYAYEYGFMTSIQPDTVASPGVFDWILNVEVLNFSLAFGLLLFPGFQAGHLLFGVLIFSLDIYFQNFVKFESSIILTHLVPWLILLLLRFPASGKEIKAGAVYILSIGYATSFLNKILSGWLNVNDPVVYGYIHEFSNGYHIQGLLASTVLRITGWQFWKLVDYSVLFFQGSFLVSFITLRFIRYQLVIAAVFHLLILLFLGIGVFFPYMLFYALILAPETKTSRMAPKQTTFFCLSAAGIFLLLFAVGKNHIHFFYNLDKSIFLYSDLAMNAACFGLFIYCYLKNKLSYDI